VRVILALVALCASAAADPCRDAYPAPVEASLRTVGGPRTPCAEKAFLFHVQGAATIDLPQFYGSLGGAAMAGLRWPVYGVEWSIEANVVDWRFVQTASYTADEFGLGPFVVGALLPRKLRLFGIEWAVAPAARLVLPPDTHVDVASMALEAAVHVGARPLHALAIQGSAVLLGWGALPTGGFLGRGAVQLSAGATLAPARWLRGSLGLEAQTGWYGPGLDHILVRGGVSVGRRHQVTLGVLAPLAGAERTDLVLDVRWSAPL